MDTIPFSGWSEPKPGAGAKARLVVLLIGRTALRVALFRARAPTAAIRSPLARYP
ncbi:hypothetical protein Sxan_27830 [Streptomyces xanthophaeus]|uniref:Uncharacterized protein n=1 Tax=Streptomyces xanthophaeus TaxID=67385 RepID=A0A919H108_9ACTN|nr:hypothetical protein Sxan_27830 [Streptomyces xanthophaeus]